MKFKRVISIAVVGLVVVVGLSGCNGKKADTVNKNLATEGDSFNILRRVVFINGITDKYLLEIEGFCSVDLSDAARYSVTCKVPGGYKRDYLSKSDNVSVLVEQLETKNVSANHYMVIFRPETIISQPVIQ